MNFEEVCLASFWILLFLIYSKIFEIILKEDKVKRIEYIIVLNIITFYFICYIINDQILLSEEEPTYIWPFVVTLLFLGGGYAYKTLRDGIKEIIEQG